MGGENTLLLTCNSVRFQFLGLIMSAESFDEFIELAFHHYVQLVAGKSDPMVRNAIFFEIVRTDLFRAVS
jgi:hypothetical protein